MVLVMAIPGIIFPLVGLMDQRTLGSDLEEYIVKGKPQDASDVERLEREYQIKAMRKAL